MCSPTCLTFIEAQIKPDGVRDKLILEIGSRYVNGTARWIIMAYQPQEYIGTDLVPGADVDVVIAAESLLTRYQPATFDGIICTEMLEHCEHWRVIIHNIKTLLKPGGWLLITTRSQGFPLHNFPADHWRYELNDMQAIFADMTIQALESDPSEPGVFMKAVKPVNFIEADLRKYKLYAVHA